MQDMCLSLPSYRWRGNLYTESTVYNLNEEYGTYNLGVHKGLKLVEAKAATKAEEGNIEYWHCEDCDRYYVEDNGYVEKKKEDTVIAKVSDNDNSNGAGSGDVVDNGTGAG